MIDTPKFISLTFLSVGVFVLMQVILPVISFQWWWLGQKYTTQMLISPQDQKNHQILGISIQNKDHFPAFISSMIRKTEAPYKEFRISIPKLQINEAKVAVDSNDLSKNLAHLPGSALPGEKGNVFISGHSALSPLFSLKKALFANLADLKKEDQIEILAAGTKFIYKVTELKVIDPNDLSVIVPPDDLGRYISLMTCVPPGLNFKRLVVLGKMI